MLDNAPPLDAAAVHFWSGVRDFALATVHECRAALAVIDPRAAANLPDHIRCAFWSGAIAVHQTGTVAELLNGEPSAVPHRVAGEAGAGHAVRALWTRPGLSNGLIGFDASPFERGLGGVVHVPAAAMIRAPFGAGPCTDDVPWITATDYLRRLVCHELAHAACAHHHFRDHAATHGADFWRLHAALNEALGLTRAAVNSRGLAARAKAAPGQWVAVW